MLNLFDFLLTIYNINCTLLFFLSITYHIIIFGFRIFSYQFSMKNKIIYLSCVRKFKKISEKKLIAGISLILVPHKYLQTRRDHKRES